jgi:hypothetical protein
MPDKPGHIIEISDALGRDVDKAKAGTLKAELPVEAFMTEGALEQVTAASAADLVPAESLVPISREEALRRETFDGQTLPTSLPTMRRVRPAPFRRERISIEHHGRSWQRCPADVVTAGDTVPGVGLVTATELVTRRGTVSGVPDVAIGMTVILTNLAGERHPFDLPQQVQAFRLAE